MYVSYNIYPSPQSPQHNEQEDHPSPPSSSSSISLYQYKSILAAQLIIVPDLPRSALTGSGYPEIVSPEPTAIDVEVNFVVLALEGVIKPTAVVGGPAEQAVSTPPAVPVIKPPGSGGPQCKFGGGFSNLEE